MFVQDKTCFYIRAFSCKLQPDNCIHNCASNAQFKIKNLYVYTQCINNEEKFKYIGKKIIIHKKGVY